MTANTSGNAVIASEIRKNGSAINSTVDRKVLSATPTQFIQLASTIVFLNVSDYIELFAFQGGALAEAIAWGDTNTSLEAFYIGN
jgi:hypothetical protein